MATTNHLREDDGQVQHRPPHGAVLVNGLPEADDFDAVLPQPDQHLGQRPAQPVQCRHLHAVPRLEGGPQAVQPGPVPGGSTAHVLEDLLAVGQHPALSLQIVGEGIWPPTLGRVFRSSFAGPGFWHSGVILRRAEFWLCWKASPFGNASQSDGPGPGPREIVIDPPCRAGEVPGPTPGHPFQSPGLDLCRLVHDPRRIADRDPSLLHRQRRPTGTAGLSSDSTLAA